MGLADHAAQRRGLRPGPGPPRRPQDHHAPRLAPRAHEHRAPGPGHAERGLPRLKTQGRPPPALRRWVPDHFLRDRADWTIVRPSRPSRSSMKRGRFRYFSRIEASRAVHSSRGRGPRRSGGASSGSRRRPRRPSNGRGGAGRSARPGRSRATVPGATPTPRPRRGRRRRGHRCSSEAPLPSARILSNQRSTSSGCLAAIAISSRTSRWGRGPGS